MRQDALIDQLNAAQRQAVLVDSGPLLVLAGAGTGKTRVVTVRIARLISRGIRPERILAVTFTNKAAHEMRERITDLLPKTIQDTPEISTFHSLCVRILRRHIKRLGYPERFSIYARGDQESVAAQVLREIKVPAAQLRPSDLLAMIGQWKTRAIRPDAATGEATNDREHLGAIAYRRYQTTLRAAGAVDFDDLLLCTEELLSQFEDVRTAEANRFDHILIDEYQDTNTSQYRIVRALAANHRNLCVVGDDDQSIYAWRGADLRHILNFARDWPRARTVRLEDNYRCTEQILNLANRLIKHNQVRHDKTLRAARPGGEQPKILQLETETVEAEKIIADIRRRIETKQIEPSDVAILFRTNEQPRAFEDELRRANLPYRLVGGMSFYDRREVRDTLAYLRLLAQPNDEPSLLRIINTPPRGISKQAVTAMLNEAVQAGTALWQTLPRADRLPDVSRPAADGIRALIELVTRYSQKMETGNLADTAAELIDEIGYRREIEKRYRDDPDAQQSRWAVVEQVVNSLADYEARASKPSLLSFLDEMMLADRDQDKEQKSNAILLMTMHSAKGLEFPHVYIVGMEEGLLPHKRSVETEGAAIDEERRLFYVGITRAQERLTLSFALTRRKWGKPHPTQPSRFLFEITGRASHESQPTAPSTKEATRKKRPPGKSGAARRPTKKSKKRRSR